MSDHEFHLEQAVRGHDIGLALPFVAGKQVGEIARVAALLNLGILIRVGDEQADVHRLVLQFPRRAQVRRHHFEDGEDAHEKNAQRDHDFEKSEGWPAMPCRTTASWSTRVLWRFRSRDGGKSARGLAHSKTWRKFKRAFPLSGSGREMALFFVLQFQLHGKGVTSANEVTSSSEIFLDSPVSIDRNMMVNSSHVPFG